VTMALAWSRVRQRKLVQLLAVCTLVVAMTGAPNRGRS
jgi:hypothetical protein